MYIVGVYNSDVGDDIRKGWNAIINGRRVKQSEIPLDPEDSADEIPERVINEATRLFASVVVRTFKKNGRPGKWYVKYLNNKIQADDDAIKSCVIANETKRPFSGRKCWILGFDK
jgi:hypothetical protein